MDVGLCRARGKVPAYRLGVVRRVSADEVWGLSGWTVFHYLTVNECLASVGHGRLRFKWLYPPQKTSRATGFWSAPIADMSEEASGPRYVWSFESAGFRGGSGVVVNGWILKKLLKKL